MRAVNAGLISIAILCIVGCSHPIEIVGEGDVTSASGERDCTLEDFLAAADVCSENYAVQDYVESYYPVPRAGWQFDHWGNYCAHAAPPDYACSFNVPGETVSAFWGEAVPPLVAVFTEIDTAVTSVESGTLRGLRTNDGLAFLGVPYAAPPIGELRWREPEPVQPWSGERDATQFGDICPQRAGSANQWGFPYVTTPLDVGEYIGDEDCLFLNVWTPHLSGSYPVMVFVHGGANVQGSGHQPLGDVLNLGQAGPAIYSGAALAARKGVVVVSINYRLGPLANLVHAQLAAEDMHGASGNYGIRDQIAALKWVEKNISQFGGDPDRVTLFGQSGGGKDVAVLIASPAAAGLFHRAIVHSAPWTVSIQSDLLEPQEALIEELNCHTADDLIDCLRGIDAKSILTARNARVPGSLSFPFAVSLDGYTVPRQPPMAFSSGAFNKVPIMVGTTEAEHSNDPDYQNLSLQQFNALLWQLVGASPSMYVQAKALYSPDRYGDYSSAYVAAFDDKGVTCAAVGMVDRIAETNPEGTFMYRFRQTLSTDTRLGFGPYHASDLIFLFQHINGEYFSVTDDERSVAGVMADYWTQFAATGAPGGGLQPGWPAYDAENGYYQSLEPTPATGEFLKRTECEFWRVLAS